MTEHRKTLAELKELEIELGLRKRDDPDVVMKVSRVQQPTRAEVTVRVARAVAPTKYGEHTWWKCFKCGRYYDAPKRMDRCVLCQFKALR